MNEYYLLGILGIGIVLKAIIELIKGKATPTKFKLRFATLIPSIIFALIFIFYLIYSHEVTVSIVPYYPPVYEGNGQWRPSRVAEPRETRTQGIVTTKQIIDTLSYPGNSIFSPEVDGTNDFGGDLSILANLFFYFLVGLVIDLIVYYGFTKKKRIIN